MILNPEELTKTQEAWLRQLLNMSKEEFIALCHGDQKGLDDVHRKLFALGAEEMDRLEETDEGHGEKEQAIHDLDRIVCYILDGQPQEAPFLAHYHTIFNREQVLRSEKCGCFGCLKVFPPSRVTEWCDLAEDTALCPYCGIDSVLGDASGYEVTEEFLREMHTYWFSSELDEVTI